MPKSGRRRRADHGFFVLAVAIGIAAGLLLDYSALKIASREEPLVIQDVNNCIAKVEAAKEGLDALRAIDSSTGNDPNAHELHLDDANVISIMECQTTLARIQNDIQSGKIPGLQGKVNELNSLIGDATKGYQIGQCTMDDPPAGTAGVPANLRIVAQIPFSGTAATASLAMSGAVSGQGTISPLQGKGGTWVGSIVVDGGSSQLAAGQASEITVTAAAPLLDNNGNPYIPRDTNTCPEGLTLDPTSGACKIICTVSKSFTWKEPPIPRIEFFVVDPPSIVKGTTKAPTLKWSIVNAKSANINGTDVKVNPEGRVIDFMEVNPIPDQTTTYSLLAEGVRSPDSDAKSVTLTVTESNPTSVNVVIGLPQQNDVIADQGVTVSGSVSPPPTAPGQMKAQILVNGSFLSEADVAPGGFFAARTALLNTIAISDIVLSGDSVVVLRNCGPVSPPIFASVIRSQDAKNNIKVIVISPATADQPAQQLGSASVQVEHGVLVNDFNYLWQGGCPGDPTGVIINPTSVVLRVNQSPVQVGNVSCGFTTNTDRVTCSDGVNMTIDTSVGTLQPVTQTWDVDVPPCQPSP